MKAMRILAAIVFSCGVAQVGFASVTITHIGDSYVFGGIGKKLGDSIPFSILERSTFESRVLQLDIPLFKYAVVKSGGSEVFASGNLTQLFTHLQLPVLNDGKRLRNFSGASHEGRRFYFESLAAAPKTDTWVMLTVGLGLIGYQLRRKQRQLAHSILSL